MDIDYAFGTDKDKEKKGVWVDLPGEEARILIARATNTEYLKAMSKAYERMRRARQQNNEEIAQEALADIGARHILLGWEGISSQGKDLEYSLENAKYLMSVEDFYKFVMEQANDIDNYRKDVEEEAGNDSETPSSGN